jgi:hypothetical protein
MHHHLVVCMLGRRNARWISPCIFGGKHNEHWRLLRCSAGYRGYMSNESSKMNLQGALGNQGSASGCALLAHVLKWQYQNMARGTRGNHGPFGKLSCYEMKVRARTFIFLSNSRSAVPESPSIIASLGYVVFLIWTHAVNQGRLPQSVPSHIGREGTINVTIRYRNLHMSFITKMEGMPSCITQETQHPGSACDDANAGGRAAMATCPDPDAGSLSRKRD